MVEKKATKTAVKKTATKKATTAKTATAAKKTTATAAAKKTATKKATAAKTATATKKTSTAKKEVIYLTAENAGFRAGDVYQALAAAEQSLSLEEVAKQAKISVEDAILGIGWLFKEGKIKEGSSRLNKNLKSRSFLT